MQSLRTKRATLDLRQTDLKNRVHEMSTHQARQKERETQTQALLDAKRGEIVTELNTVSELVDQIAGATALLHVLKERNKQYGVYSAFVEQIYQKVNSKQQH